MLYLFMFLRNQICKKFEKMLIISVNASKNFTNSTNLQNITYLQELQFNFRNFEVIMQRYIK